MISADGIFADEERDFIQTFARKWGYKMDRIEPLFNMARAGKLSIRMPQDPGKRKKIYDMMVKAAGIDNTVTDEERQLLEYVKNTYL